MDGDDLLNALLTALAFGLAFWLFFALITLVRLSLISQFLSL